MYPCMCLPVIEMLLLEPSPLLSACKGDVPFMPIGILLYCYARFLLVSKLHVCFVCAMFDLSVIY